MLDWLARLWRRFRPREGSVRGQTPEQQTSQRKRPARIALAGMAFRRPLSKLEIWLDVDFSVSRLGSFEDGDHVEVLVGPHAPGIFSEQLHYGDADPQNGSWKGRVIHLLRMLHVGLYGVERRECRLMHLDM